MTTVKAVGMAWRISNAFVMAALPRDARVIAIQVHSHTGSCVSVEKNEKLI